MNKKKIRGGNRWLGIFTVDINKNFRKKALENGIFCTF